MTHIDSSASAKFELSLGDIRRTRIVKSVLMSSLIILVAALLFVPQLDRPMSAQDEGALLVYPERIMAGDTLYRDFDAIYGPLTFWTLTATYRAAGSNITVERLVGFLYRVIIALGIMAIASKWTTSGSVLAGAVALVVMAPFGVGAFGWFGGMACLIVSVALLLRANGRWTILAGLLSGCALGFREDLVVAVALTAVTALAFRRANWRFFTAGFGLSLIFYGVATFRAGPSNLIQDLFISPVLDISSGRRLPLSHLSLLTAFDFWTLAIGTAVLTVVGLLAVVSDRTNIENQELLVIVMLALGVFPQAIQRPDDAHIQLVACVTLPLLIVPLVRLFRHSSTGIAHRIGRHAAINLGILLLSVTLVLFARAQLNETPTIWVTNGHRRVPLSGKYGQNVASLVPVLDQVARSGDRLFIGTQDLSVTPYTDTELYFLFPNLQPSTYYLEFNPGDANRTGTRLSSDVARSDILVLDSYWTSHWSELNSSLSPGDRTANDVVQNNFCLISTVGTFEVFRHCSK